MSSFLTKYFLNQSTFSRFMYLKFKLICLILTWCWGDTINHEMTLRDQAVTATGNGRVPKGLPFLRPLWVVSPSLQENGCFGEFILPKNCNSGSQMSRTNNNEIVHLSRIEQTGFKELTNLQSEAVSSRGSMSNTN
jgi:hypothetical protein